MQLHRRPHGEPQPDATAADLRNTLTEADLDQLMLAPRVTTEAIDGLKFAECLPTRRAIKLVTRCLADPDRVGAVRGERLGTANLTSPT